MIRIISVVIGAIIIVFGIISYWVIGCVIAFRKPTSWVNISTKNIINTKNLGKDEEKE